MRQHLRKWSRLFWSLAATVIVAELSSAIGLMIIHRPVYWTAQQPPKEVPPRTEKDPWGAWGTPNSTSRFTFECFDVEYKLNSAGARDKERRLPSQKRWIVLGDSFVEGYGIEQQERFTDILESRTGWEFANFGSAGDFGPLQYLLLYKGLAKRFEHQGVIVGLLPFNDFTDNDNEWWRRHKNQYQQNRYRPYSILSKDRRSYQIIYGTTGNGIPRADFNVPPPPDHGPPPKKLSAIRMSLRHLSEVSATFSLLRQLSSEWTLHNTRYSGGYFTNDQREITAVKLALDDLGREIGNRPKIMLLFPMRPDLQERRKRGKPFSDPVSQFLFSVRSAGWTIIDLSDALSEVDESSFQTLGCDAHLNAADNRLIAEFLLSHYSKLLTGVSIRQSNP